MDEFDMGGGGEDEGQIALAALKEMRGVLRSAMSRMPSQAAEERESAPEAALETDDPALELEEEAPAEEAPVVEKKTVLESIVPKYGGGSGPPPPMGKLKAKKKGF